MAPPEYLAKFPVDAGDAAAYELVRLAQTDTLEPGRVYGAWPATVALARWAWGLVTAVRAAGGDAVFADAPGRLVTKDAAAFDPLLTNVWRRNHPPSSTELDELVTTAGVDAGTLAVVLATLIDSLVDDLAKATSTDRDTILAHLAP